jgi:predicted N-acetyltransferase YhbS
MSDLVVRRAADADLPAVLELLRTSMGRSDDERFEALFRWKHIENAFGPSPMWVACDADAIVGFRVFMRWEFEHDGRVERAVRAVDTATHPDYQGRGIFTSLTLRGLDELEAEGVDFVFNTPNDKSRPGYLKMGWHELGRPVTAIRPTRLLHLPALRGARTAANHWSENVTAGIAAADFLRERSGVEQLLARLRRTTGRRTRLAPDVLVWRFGLPVLGYRAIAGDPDDGVAFVRVRRRGGAREGVVALTLVPGDEDTARRATRRLLAHVRRALRNDADYLLGLDRLPGFVPVRGLGPVVTARPIAGAAPAAIGDLALSLGDIELF